MFIHLQNKLDVWETLVAAGHVLYTLNIYLPNISFSNEVLLIFFSLLLPKKVIPCDRKLSNSWWKKDNSYILNICVGNRRDMSSGTQVAVYTFTNNKKTLSYWPLEYLYRWTFFQIQSLVQYYLRYIRWIGHCFNTFKNKTMCVMGFSVYKVV